MKTEITRPFHHSLRMRLRCVVASALVIVAALLFVQPAHASLVDDFAQYEADSLRYIQEHGVDSISNWSQSQWTSNAANTGLTAQAELPSKYDLRNVDGNNYVTPVKLQNPWGSCWSFGAIAAVETSILSELGVSYSDFPLDLSERQLAWFSGTKLPDAETMKQYEALAPYASQAGEGITPRMIKGINPFASPLNTGGTPFYATTLFAAGVGPLVESEAPYKNDENMAFTNIKDPQGWLHAGEKESAVKNVDQTDPEQHSEDYYNSIVMVRPDETAADVSKYDPDYKRFDVTSVVDKSTLSEYADAPRFDANGNLIGTSDYSASPYTWGLSEDKRLFLSVELEESRSLPSPANADANGTYVYDEAGTQAIKNELMAGRGVHIEFCADQSMPDEATKQGDFLNQKSWAQYTFDKTGQGKKVSLNHDVCIVGWDDDYPASNFNSGTFPAVDAQGNPVVDEKDVQIQVPKNPGKDGAWIVKNSWGAGTEEFPNNGGTDWGIVDENGKHTGYFYLSYYDMSIARPTSYNFYPESIYGTKDTIFINQYDFMPAYDVFAMTSTSDNYSVANIFSAENDQFVRTLSVETLVPNTHVTLQLYRLNDGATTPVDGELIETLEDDFAYGGFHRLQTKAKHFMEKDQRFSVVATLSSTDASGKKSYQIPMHRSFSEEFAQQYNLKIYASGIINPGESYALDEGKWVDWTEELVKIRNQDPANTDSFVYDNFALKAFADESIPYSIEKSIVDAKDVYNPGDEIKYKVVVRNESEKEALENIVVEDSLVDLGDAGKIEKIGVGEEVTVTYGYVVTEQDAKRGSVENTAKATLADVEGIEAESSTKAICAEKAKLSIHRLYNSNSGEHFYTKATPEYNMLIELGWADEGFGWTAPEESNTPVFRLYNAIGGEHHFTTSESERDFLISIGWNDEGTGWCSDDSKTTPLHRDYNPNAFANNHNYTASLEEHEYLNSIGWRDEGIGWYGL